MTESNMCRICGEGHLTPAEELINVEYKGYHSRILMLYQVCSVCGAQADYQDVAANKRAMEAFQYRVDTAPHTVTA